MVPRVHSGTLSGCARAIIERGQADLRTRSILSEHGGLRSDFSGGLSEHGGLRFDLSDRLSEHGLRGRCGLNHS